MGHLGLTLVVVLRVILGCASKLSSRMMLWPGLQDTRLLYSMPNVTPNVYPSYLCIYNTKTMPNAPLRSL